MIKIGDFARLSQVSVVTLRYYDEMDLLKPARVDAFSGYRFYSADQLPRLNRILALRDLGFSLEQIRLVLADGLTPEQLRSMLTLQRNEVEKRLAEEQDRLSRIEARLRQIELEDKMSTYDVVVKNTPAMRVVSRRVTVPTNDQVPQYLDAAYMEVYSYVHAQGAKQTGPHFTLWHSPSDVYENEEVEAIVPIDRPLKGTDRVQVYELPSTQVAAVVHQGNFEDFQQGHAAILEWIDANAYRIVGPYREIYIQHDRDDLSDSTTEVQFPVEKCE
ncbi:MAG TPA: MerR family transcriptional regulator [Anaerolineales bacterium]|nr:MerR family transcriptional regulator [Anaerolineales bacterium]